MQNSWNNYGDIGYLDEGGVQVRATNQKGWYDVVLVIPNSASEDTVFAGHTSLDLTDYKNDEKIIAYVKEAWGEDYEYTDADLAAIVAEYEGLIELSMTAFNDNGSQAGYSMDLNAYKVDKLTLARGLAEMGIDVHERLMELEAEAEDRETLAKDQYENFETLLNEVYDGVSIQREPDGTYSMINISGGDKIETAVLHNAQDVANELIDIMECHIESSPDVFYDLGQLNDISDEEIENLTEQSTLEAYCEFMNRHPDIDVQYGAAIIAAYELKQSGACAINIDDFVKDAPSKNNRTVEREE